MTFQVTALDTAPDTELFITMPALPGASGRPLQEAGLDLLRRVPEHCLGQLPLLREGLADLF